MSKVLIVVESSGDGIDDSPTLVRMVSVLTQVITTSTYPPVTVQVVKADTLEQIGDVNLDSESSKVQLALREVLLCPLTLSLPDPLPLPFPAKRIYQTCRDVPGLRQRLAQQLRVGIADGCFWLPVVMTAKGPLYGEVISLAAAKMPEDRSLCNLSYYQPFHLSDATKQQLYQMGHCLLQLLSAPPATYLMQFAFQDSEICFDRLWPFPAPPAIASLGVQEPDLFTCHWYCLNRLPVLDLTIIPSVAD